MADSQRCGQTDLDLLAISRNAKEVAGRWRTKAPPDVRPASCNCELGIYSERALEPSLPHSHSGARSLLCDLEGRYYRQQQSSATTKRQPTVPIPLRLLTCGAGPD
jgi:hypothetical protein